MPENYQFSHLQPVVTELGFEDPVAVSFYKQRKGRVWCRDWCFKATRRDRLQVVQRPVKWDGDNTVEFVVLREHARRMRQVQHQPLASSRGATSADFAADRQASKPGSKSRKATPVVNPVHSDAAAKVPGPTNSAESTADSKGSKHAAAGDDESAAPYMDQSQGLAGADWAPNAPLLNNAGGGNCLCLALATLDLGGKPRNHRQLRRFVSQCLQDFEKDCKQAWLHGGSYNCVGRQQACSWEAFLAEQAQNSSWGGAVEIALCRGLDVRGWLSTDTGELHLFNPDATSGFFALHYKASDQHYLAYRDPVEQEFQARYTALGGKIKDPDQLCVRGGGALTDCDSGLGSTAKSGSKKGPVSRPVARPLTGVCAQHAASSFRCQT